MPQCTTCRLLLCVLLVASVVGCASPQLAIYPMENQDSSVQESTQRGYTYLQSKDGGSVVTVSLRGATQQYMKAYVSVSHSGSAPVQVDPTTITVVDSSGQTFSAYAPEEVPAVVKQDAAQSSQTVLALDQINVSNSRLIGRNVTEAGTGGYGSSGESSTSYLDFMLRQQTLSEGTATSGLVFTPFDSNISSFRLKVPVGQTTHTFHFSVETVK